MSERVWLIRTTDTVGIFADLGRTNIEALTELEAMKEAQRAISREIVRRESKGMT